MYTKFSVTTNTVGVLALTLMVALSAFTIDRGLNVGDRAVDFHLKNVDGNTISLADYKNAKGFIVIFHCNTCPYSNAYDSRIVALNKKYAPLDYPVIAINSNDPTTSAGDSFEKMISDSKRKGYDFPYLVDETQEVARSYGATNTPHVFVLSRTGDELKVAYIGGIDDNARNPSAVSKKYVEAAVDALLDGKPVQTTRTRALGCTIKWKE